MYIYMYTAFCRNRITLHRYVTVFIVPHMDIEQEDNKQFFSNIPRMTVRRIQVEGGEGGGGGGKTGTFSFFKNAVTIVEV